MKLSILLAGAAMVIAPMNVAQAANVEIVAQSPVIELSVSEQVDSAPDTATFSTGVETKAPTATQALRDNSVQARAVIDRLKSLGIAEKDIQTTGINLRADYDYDQESRENRFVGYVVSNQVSATVKDISKLGKILDAIVSSGATNLNGPSFSISDDSKLKDVARERALASAKSRAMSYARSEGYSGVRVLSISEGMSNQSEAPMMRMEASASKSAPPIAPGQVGTVVSLNITYEMTR
ncbi:SIMPL domain-containing protein [uncultured Parasphingorhabdus sp.]|uniref:SIMPL domain-containing protein n=1 Tax=uncultured Parasphingorhabdus sp. TaxID=2709694 RepID=UPI0030DC1DD1